MSYMVLLSVLVGSIGAKAPRIPGANLIEDAYFDFHVKPDKDFVLPDGWIQTRAEGYPDYVKPEFTYEEAAVSTRSLTWRLNGGNCALYSPYFPASDKFNYVATVQVKTKGLVNDKAFLLMEFLDLNKRLVGRKVFHSEPIGGTRDWTMLQVGPLAPPSEDTRFLRVACVSQHGDWKDLTGSVYFDDIWVGTLPRMKVTTSGAYRIFEIDSRPKTVSLRVSGVEERKVYARFQLSNEKGRLLKEKIIHLPRKAGEGSEAEWDLPIQEVGFYHLDIGIHEEERAGEVAFANFGSEPIVQDDYPITVLRPGTQFVSGMFGFSGPISDQESDTGQFIGLEHHERLLRYSQSRWLKVPLWGDPVRRKILSRTRDFASFVERLERKGHRVIGVIGEPSQQVLDQLPQPPSNIFDVFGFDRNAWNKELDGMLSQYGLKVNQWQVGRDDDTSLGGIVPIDPVLRILKRAMNLISQDVRLGLPLNYLSLLPGAKTLRLLEFLTVTDQLSSEGLNPADSRQDQTLSPMASHSLMLYLQDLNRKLDEKAIKALIDELGDKEESVRAAAAQELGDIGPALIARQDDRRESVRVAAAKELDDIVPALIVGLDDRRESVRVATTEALGKIGILPSDVVPMLITALEDRHGSVRFAAALALSKFGPTAKDAVAVLSIALQDREESVRLAAADAIGRIDPVAANDLGLPPPQVRLARGPNKRFRPAIWTHLLPLSAIHYDRRDRIVDLTQRVLAAKIGGSDAIFVTKVFVPEYGLTDAEGAPNELYTIWRTLAENLSVAKYLGELPIYKKNDDVQIYNRVFERGQKAMIFIWSDQPTSVDLVVGESATITDLWGRTTSLGDKIAQPDPINRIITHHIDIDRTPIIITEANGPLINFQMGVRFVKGQVPNVFGDQFDWIHLPNTFPQTLNGNLKPRFPERWEQKPDEFELQIPRGKNIDKLIELVIPQGVLQGDHIIPLEFHFDADRKYDFSMFLPYRYGGDEVSAIPSSQLLPEPDGRLKVEVELINLMNAPLSLQEGTLRVLGRPAVRCDAIVNLPPGEKSTAKFYLPRGKELIGERMVISFNGVGNNSQYNYELTAE